MRSLILALCVVLAAFVAVPAPAVAPSGSDAVAAPSRPLESISRLHPIRRLVRCVRCC